MRTGIMSRLFIGSTAGMDLQTRRLVKLFGENVVYASDGDDLIGVSGQTVEKGKGLPVWLKNVGSVTEIEGEGTIRPGQRIFVGDEGKISGTGKFSIGTAYRPTPDCPKANIFDVILD